MPVEAFNEARGLLEGFRVVDLTTTFLGPYCTLLMAQQGADVIKVEAPGGDITRDLGRGRSPGMASVFMSVNHGKRSMVLDLKRDADRETLLRLATTADVFIHNMRREAAVRLGIDYARIRAVREDIVYCAAQGFGSAGPYAHRPAYDDTIQAMSGLAGLQSRLSRGPAYVASVVADKTSAMTALYAILGALLARERTGHGHELEIPMFETMATFTLIEHIEGRLFEPPSGAALYPRVVSANRRPYVTQDGEIAVMLYTDEHWRRFLDDVGRADLIADPRFASPQSRTANIDEVYGFLQDQLASGTTAAWLARLERIDVPAVRVNTTDDLFEDEHLLAVGLFEHFEHPTEGALVQPRSPVIVDGQTLDLPARGAPRLGEHTEEILAELA